MPSQPGRRLRSLSRILRGEQKVTAATRRALQALLREAARALAASGYDTAVLDDRFPGWRTALNDDVLPAILTVFTEAWDATARGVIDPTMYATRHLEAVHNRLIGVSDDVFDAMRLTLEEGRQAQEGIPQLAGRVDALLADDQRWTNRAVTVARTEVISANNAGAHDSAYASAEVLGENPAAIVKEWLATGDGRTRESHAEADGQQIMGLDAPFIVGGYDLTYPGDPGGPPEEVINCRCSVVYLMPGDPSYPTGALATGSPLAASNAPAPAAPASDAPAPAPAAPVVEETPVDSGPANDMERMARALTLDELAMETRRGSAKAKQAAKAELRRRGIAASGGRYLTEAEVRDGTVDPSDLGLYTPDGIFVQHLEAWLAAPDPQEDPVTETAPEPTTAPPDAGGPTHAGIAVQASDTGRILMQQRTWDEEDAPEVRGTWEFPGGSLEDGETPEAGAWREWVEETGLPIPEHTITGGWRSPDGVYQGFVATVTDETTVGPLNPDHEAAVSPNPDDPDREAPDVAAWFTAEQIQGMGAAVRPEVLSGTDWSQFAPTPEEDPVETDPALEAALAAVRQAGYTVSMTGGDTISDATVTITAAEEPLPPPPAPDAENPEEAPAPLREEDGEPFYGIIWPEGVESGDRRGVEVGATTWRDLPLPIMAQDAQAPGHDGAVRVGRLDAIERDETTYAVPVIRYRGVWDTNPAAMETARQVDKRMVRGISTDGDAVTVELRSSSGETLDPMVDDFPEDGVVVEVATAARISGGTVCSVPAFHQAYIANGRLEDRTDPEPGWNEDGTPKDNVLNPPAPTEEQEEAMPEAVAASAWSLTASAPIVQPASAFTRPAALDDNPEGTPLTVTDDGRVYGHLAVWGTCHIGIDGLCQEPPASATNYAYFATGSVATDDGNYMPTGPLVMDTGHAALTLGHRPAAAHYDNTGTAVADVVMGQDHIGIWYSGMLRPGITPEKVYALRAAGKVSGDWRNIGGNLELVAALVVNTPGFSIPRPAFAASAAGGAEAMVAAGMVRTPRPPETRSEAERVADLVVATLDRRERARVAASRITTRLASRRRERAVVAAARIREKV